MNNAARNMNWRRNVSPLNLSLNFENVVMSNDKPNFKLSLIKDSLRPLSIALRQHSTVENVI